MRPFNEKLRDWENKKFDALEEEHFKRAYRARRTSRYSNDPGDYLLNQEDSQQAEVDTVERYR